MFALPSEFNGYTYWSAGQPDNAGNKEDCVNIFENGEWNDLQCGDQRVYGYICKMNTSGKKKIIVETGLFLPMYFFVIIVSNVKIMLKKEIMCIILTHFFYFYLLFIFKKKKLFKDVSVEYGPLKPDWQAINQVTFQVISSVAWLPVNAHGGFGFAKGI